MNPDDFLFSGSGAGQARLAQHATFRTVLVVLPLILFGTLPASRPAATALMAVLIVVVVALYSLALSGRDRAAMAGLIAVLIVFGAADSLAAGQTLGLATLALIGAVLVAGLFFGAGTLKAVTAISAAALAAHGIGEAAGWLPSSNQHLGPLPWLMYTLLLVGIAVKIHSARNIVLDAFRRSENNLVERQRAEAARAEAELARAQAEEAFAASFHTSPAALLLTRLSDLKIVDLNQAHAGIFGWPRDQAAGRTTLELGMWARAEDHPVLLNQSRVGKQTRNQAHRLRRRNGETFDAVVSTAIMDWQGSPHILSAVTDITAEQATQTALELTRRRFETIFHASPIGIVITDIRDSSFVEVNAAAAAILGVNREEMSGTPVNRFYLNPEQHQQVRERLEREGSLHNLPLSLRRVDGDVCELLFSAVSIREGEMRYSLNMVVDITTEMRARQALKESERRFAAAFNFSPIGMTITRIEDGTILEVNQADGRMLGYSREEMLGRSTMETGAWESEQARDAFLAVLHRDKRVLGHDSRMRTKSGQVLDTRIFCELIEMEGAPCILTAILDVTEEKRVQAEIRALNDSLEARVRERTAELEKAVAELAALNHDLEAFSYSVSHDLRAPLRGIHGFTQMLEIDHGAGLPEGGRQMLAQIETSATRMGGIIDDMLRLFNVIRADLRPARVDVSAMAAQVAARIGEADPARQVAWHIAPGLQAVADAGLLKLVLENLLGNAWKYSSKVEAASIEVLAGAADGDSAEFRVRDNGAGFDMRYADQLFKPFRRLHTSREFDGNGIGLATVHRILQRHGGSIRAQSTVGQGACFTVSLPRRAEKTAT